MSLAARLRTYQAERFPLVRNLPLLAVFAGASLSVSATLAGRPLPGPGAFLAAFGLAAILFFQMRAADEWKDREIDRRHRPERPIPRGLVSLRLILGIALALCLPAAVLAWGAGVGWLLAAVWLWLAAMTAEFGARAWLTARPVLYLVSHMAILPLIDLMLTGVEWAGHGPAPALWWFLALSFANGCVLEIGRKCWAPASERHGVESYSGLWGPAGAASAWLGCVALAAALLTGLGTALGLPWSLGALAAAGTLAAATLARHFGRAPTPAGERRIDAASGLWVLACYAAAGAFPLIGDLP